MKARDLDRQLNSGQTPSVAAGEKTPDHGSIVKKRMSSTKGQGGTNSLHSAVMGNQHTTATPQTLQVRSRTKHQNVINSSNFYPNGNQLSGGNAGGATSNLGSTGNNSTENLFNLI